MMDSGYDSDGYRDTETKVLILFQRFLKLCIFWHFLLIGIKFKANNFVAEKLHSSINKGIQHFGISVSLSSIYPGN